MSQKTEKAVNNYKNGYTCAQAVACEEAGIDEKTMFRLTEAQGVGLGGMEGHCGALSGAAAVLGAVNSTADLEKTDSKGKTIGLSRELTKRFQEKNGAVICKELKGIEKGKNAEVMSGMRRGRGRDSGRHFKRGIKEREKRSH